LIDFFLIEMACTEQEMLEWLADAEEEDRRRAQEFSQVNALLPIFLVQYLFGLQP
jgi:hypothetical protein